VLLLCDLYRQRFYLDPQSERGLHWRVALLHLAKWPYTLLALCEVIMNRRMPYALTAKVRPKSRRLLLFWPHLSVALLVSVAWLIGMAFGNIRESLLHAWAAVVVAGSLGLALTDFMRFPDPYDKKLVPSAGQGEEVKELILSR
jgi:hypothetical protein